MLYIIVITRGDPSKMGRILMIVITRGDPLKMGRILMIAVKFVMP